MGKENVGSDVEKVSSKVRNLRVERNEKQKSWVCLKKKRERLGVTGHFLSPSENRKSLVF